LSWEAVYDISGSRLIVRDRAAIRLFDERSDAYRTINLISGAHKICGKFVHPLQRLGIGDVIRLDQELDGIRPSENIAHMPEIH
jgi:hypothetical protein